METEFKFHIPHEHLKAVEAALRGADAVRTRLRASYFDTADGTLAARGVVLRLRQEGRRWVQTAKATGDGPLRRLEHNVELGAARAAAAPPAPDVRRHDGTPVGERLAEALGAAADAPLVETYGTDIWRLTRQVEVGGATVELALDLGRITAPPLRAGDAARATPVCELELELVQGDVRGLVALAAECAQQHGLWFSTVSKAERGARLLAGLEQVPAVKAAAPRFGGHGRPRPSGRALQRVVIAACLAQILPNASEVAAGSEDAEQIHQLRVGIRRLRTALRELDGLAAGLDSAWQAPLAEAFRALGARRDREVVLQAVQPRLRAAGAPAVELPPDAVPGVSPGAAVRAPAFQSVLVALIGFTAQGDDGAADDGHGAQRPAGVAVAGAADANANANVDVDVDAQVEWCVDAPAESAAEARRRLRARLQKLHARTVRDGRRFESLTPAERHGVRKRLKRLRYLAEFVASLFDAHAARRYLERLEPAQDALGRANDEAVALQAYRAAAASDARAWFAVGWLGAHEPDGVRASRQALRRIAGAPRFWKRKKKAG